MLLLFFWEPPRLLKAPTARNWGKGYWDWGSAGFVERNRHGADHGLDLGIGRGIALVVRTREINLVLAREVNSELSGGEAVETAEGKEPD